MSLEFRVLQPQEFYQKHVEAGVRPDGRRLAERRPVAASAGNIKSADGSAIVRQGNTTVVCGIKLELAAPATERPNQGYLVPNLTLPPMCNPQFKPGPPSEEAQAASHFVQQVLLQSKCIDLSELCPVPGKLCWVLYLDMVCLDHDGNIRDAAVAAAVAALQSLQLPHVSQDPETEKISVSKERSCLKLKDLPVSCTFAIYQLDTPHLVADPSWEEEELAQATISVVSLQSGEVCLTEHSGGAGLDPAILQSALSLATEQATHITKALHSLRL